jgi:hypothetical protein
MKSGLGDVRFGGDQGLSTLDSHEPFRSYPNGIDFLAPALSPVIGNGWRDAGHRSFRPPVCSAEKESA